MSRLRWGGAVGRGQLDRRDGPATLRVRQRHGAVPTRRELPRDRQPEPGAAAAGGAADGAAVEAMEHGLLLTGRQARTLVTHGQATRLNGHGDRLARRAVV